jgi:fatty-acyl-CoA synthase
MERLTQSYAHGRAAVTLLGDTIGARLEKTAAEHGEREALVVVHQNVRWTFADLNARAEAFAAGLLALGLQPGDRVGVWSPNNAEWILAQYATAKAGLILVNINPAYRVSELEYVLNKVGCRALVTAQRLKTSDYVAMLNTLAPELATAAPGKLSAARLPHLEVLIAIGAGTPPGFVAFDDVAGLAVDADRARLTQIAAALQFDDAINIQFTSGTTGSPKGATLSHHNILNNGLNVCAGMAFGPGDRLCLPVPLYHCFGMSMGVLGCLAHAATIVLPAETFDPAAVIAAVAAERCTGLYGVPTMFAAILAHPALDGADVSSLRTGIMAGAPCPPSIMREVMGRLNMTDVTIAYGMTETSPVSCQTAIDDAFERRIGTVGRPHPNIEIKIVDTDGRVVAPGTPGELCTRGYSVMVGYWGDPAATAQSIDAHGWMHTGDLATMDEDGYVAIVGRIKDMVIRGGENIYPREIEDFLMQHEAVLEAHVFGVPDERWGEQLCAWIRVRPGKAITPDEVRAFARENIAHYKTPYYVEIVEEAPMTVTGKPQKYLMREAMIAKLALS